MPEQPSDVGFVTKYLASVWSTVPAPCLTVHRLSARKAEIIGAATFLLDQTGLATDRKDQVRADFAAWDGETQLAVETDTEWLLLSSVDTFSGE